MRISLSRTPAILAVVSLAFAAAAYAQAVAVTGGTVIDGTGSAPMVDAVVLIRDGRIAAVGKAGSVTIPASATRIDARGKFVIPGLMDANLHLFLNADLETLIKYEDRYHEIVLEAAQIALKTGQTTVFDTWGPTAALIKARDMINAGSAPGSRIYLAGNIIGFSGPLGPDFRGASAAHVSKAFATVLSLGPAFNWKLIAGRLGNLPAVATSCS
jgi:imidazolonepropionase-like amidohydrolase